MSIRTLKVLGRDCYWNSEQFVFRSIPTGHKGYLYGGSNMSAHVLLNLLTSLGKEIKCEACRAFYFFFATRSINPITQEHEC